jgi:hypothetical protein
MGAYEFQGLPLSPRKSTVSFASPTVALGSTDLVTLTVRDTAGNTVTGLLAADFSLGLSGGTSTGTFGSVSETSTPGTYQATFTGVRAGTAATLTATIDGVAVTSALPTITVTPARATITWPSPADIVYGTALSGTQLDATASAVVNGSTVSVPGTFSYTLADGRTPALGAVLSAGQNQALRVSFTPTDAADYTGTSAAVTLTVDPAALTITADNQSINYGGSVPPLTYHYTGLVNGDTSASFTGGLVTTATSGSGVGSYPITQSSLAATGNYTIGTFKGGTLTVAPAPLSAAAVNFSATAGAPFSGTVATFTNADPYGSAASYTALITWGDGITSAGVISGTGSTLTVSGSHTYADPVNQTLQVTISHKLGYTATATATATATVTSLGQGVVKGLTGRISFWQTAKGQALIARFGSTATGLTLANWLAVTFPNLYGTTTGSNNLSGTSNADVATYFENLFNLGGNQAQARVLATALSVYATTTSLGGTAGVANGFSVSATGLGADSFNVGRDGAAFGVANNTTLNVYELLLAVNKQAINGVLYNGNTTLEARAANLFSALNKAGSIG